MRTPEEIRRHYRNGWIGTLLGVAVVALIIGLSVEISFIGRYFGEGSLALPILKTSLPPVFLAFLILRDRADLDTLEMVRTVLLLALFSGLFATWAVALSNRRPLAGLSTYTVPATLSVHKATYGSRFGNTTPDPELPPDYFFTRVILSDGRTVEFTTPRRLFPPDQIGAAIVFPVVRGRWGQDFIDIPE